MKYLVAVALLAGGVLAEPLTVTVTEGTNLAAAVSPDRRSIVVDLQGALWSIPFEGGAATRITGPLLEPARPDFSPQGGLIAFEAYQGGTFHIWTMQPDGAGLHPVTDGHGDDREPRFSPDGSKIAFASDRAFEGSYDIWVVELASGKLTRRTSGPEDEFEPTWSPDGSEIAFISGPGANGTSIQAIGGSGAIRTIQTAPPGAHLNSPAWSPAGSQIAYTQFEQGKSRLMISGKPAGPDEDVFPFYPVWLAENRILYTGNGAIRTIRLDSGQVETIPFHAQFDLNRPAYPRKRFDLDSPARKQVKGVVGPALSPNGKQVVFEALNQIWLMDIGGKPRPLTHDKFYKTDPAWSPDGKRIAYSSDKLGVEYLFVLDLATKEEKLTAPFTTVAAVSAAWSPDGKLLACQNQTGATIVIDVETGNLRQVIPAQFAPSKPSWSADGKRIAIGALKPYTRRFREGASQILTVDLATGALTYTEPAPFQSLSTRGEDGPVYSPDGSAAAFVMRSVLWIQPLGRDGFPSGPARQINREATDAPTWSGDSKRLLYLSNGKLRLISRDGSGLSTVPLELSWSFEDTSERTLIHAGRLWNGRGPEVQEDVDIVTARHRIESIRPHTAAAHRAAQGSGGRIVDASKLTVIPGLWESHTHEWLSGKFWGDRLGRLWLAYGVTALESQGDPAYRAVETRESFGSGARIGPRYFASGEALDGERIYYNMMRPTTSAAQLELELSRAQALDYDLLKTYVRLPHALQEIAMRFAHEKMGVVTTSHYMLPGMAYGMDGMTHLSATSRLGFSYTRSAGGISYGDVRTLYAASKMFVISTTFQSFPLYAEDPPMIDDVRLKALNPPWDRIALASKRDLALGKPGVAAPGPLGGNIPVILTALQHEEETVAFLLRNGGIVLAGTDSPIDNVATALHLNLRAQVKYGLEPWQALQTATLLPARAFGVERDLGTLEPGKLADLVLVSGDPLRDIKDAANVQSVMKNGRLYTIPELIAPYPH